MLIPFKVKNPPKHFPIATVSIIGLNVLVYLFTSDIIAIHESVVNDYGFILGKTPWYTVFTAAFLHGDIFHIAGNMLFLWIFGPPVEDRLGIPKYLGLYFLAGLAGALLQGVFGGDVPSIGASGCIMGVMGAYWYIFPWSTVCVWYFFWIIMLYTGVWEVQAIWVIGVYLALNLIQGVMSFGEPGGGIAYFCHVGGGIAGILFCMALRMKRDTEAVSEAKAIQADARNLHDMPLHALQTMHEEDPHNTQIIRAMLTPAMRLGQASAITEAMHKAGPKLIDVDPNLVAFYLVDMHGNPDLYAPLHLLRLGGILERTGDPQRAIGVYRIITEGRPMDPASETALYRTAHCAWNSFRDVQTARTCLTQLQERFPHGEMIPFARNLLRQMG